MGNDCDLIRNFLMLKNHLQSSIIKKAEVYLHYKFDDPFIKHAFLQELYNLVRREMIDMSPSFPHDLLPKCKMRIFPETLDVEITVQNYLNMKKDLLFLGSIDINDKPHDFYIKDNQNIAYDHMFFARYGNDNLKVHSGSQQAVDEYMLGVESPLSIAYALAIEDGLIVGEE